MGANFSFHPISSTCKTETAYTIPTGVFVLYSMLMVISGGFAGVVIARVVLRRICKWKAPATSIARLIEYLVSIYTYTHIHIHTQTSTVTHTSTHTGLDCRHD